MQTRDTSTHDGIPDLYKGGARLEGLRLFQGEFQIRFRMELTLLPKGFWTSDSKPAHHPFPDTLVTVYTTQEIAKETVLGPCLLQDIKLDTVAFIALKCSEKRNIHYIIKVDAASVPNPGGFPWMRLVQAASNKKEQNLEAYLDNGQLYYRPTRTIFRNEELLVWYDEELSRLLGFSEIQASRRLQNELGCPSCKQVFREEHSYLSHARFLCFPEKSAQLWRSLSAPKTTKRRLAEQPTNFHSLARDVEVKTAAWKEDASSLARERTANCNEAESDPGRKTVLLEKTNRLRQEYHSGSRDEGMGQQASGGPRWTFILGGNVLLQKDAVEETDSAFTEVRRAKEKPNAEEVQEVPQAHSGKEQAASGLVPSSSGSAFSLVWPARVSGEPKSAFRKPAKSLLDRKATGAPCEDETLSGCLSTMDIRCYSSLLTSKIFVGDFSGSPFLQNRPSPCSSELWPRLAGGQIWTVPASGPRSASLTLLPSTFTSFSVAAQNWCAKCSLAFRMTSDLVFHMRSHHKKEGASPESQSKRRREGKLTCPVCQEYFRERHHLSRHMISHN